MKKSLFSTAALLCAVSFNALQASHGNPYRMGPEDLREPGYIRVITEIPVNIAGFMMPRHSCEQAGLSGASESKKSDTKALVESLLDSSTKKSTKDERFVESVLQLLIALTKNLKIVDDDSVSSSAKPYVQPTFGITSAEEFAKRMEEAKKAAEEARAAQEEAIKAADEVKKARTAEEQKAKARGAEAVKVLADALA
ncbi:MAG: hypothetical protein WCN27_00515, partial [Alphaproteobacteria bacterium]